MRIGIDCRTMLNPDGGERAGVGHYTTALVDGVLTAGKKDDFVLFFDHEMPQSAVDAVVADRPNVSVVRFPYSEYKRYLPIGYSHVFVATALRRANLDLFHSPAYTIPLQYGRPSVVTVHDLAIYKHPSWFPPKQQFSTRVAVPKSIRKAARVICVSRATAKSVKQLFGVPASRISVIYEGVDQMPATTAAEQAAVRAKFGVAKRFIFFVGTLEPRKNLENLVKAFDHFISQNHPRQRDLQLVIGGGKGWKHQQIFRTIARAKWSGNIRVIGYVTAAEKAALMDAALFFAFPSRWEGFGLPVLEAASRGVPVLTSRISSLPEVVGPGALYVRPESVRSIQQGIADLVRSAARRDALGRKGRDHAKAFTWQRCARETLAVYHEVGAAGRKTTAV